MEYKCRVLMQKRLFEGTSIHRSKGGRAHFPHYIYDYADMQVPVLARMYAKRLKGYLALGYSVAK